MSVQADVPPYRSVSAGSLFGSAVGAEQLWNRLAGSPTLRPQTPSIASSLHLDRHDESMADCGDMLDNGNESAPPMLESVVHTHELPEQFAFAYWERDSENVAITTPSGAIVHNAFPVRPRVVLAERIVWRPVLGRDGLAGHRFDFVDGMGEVGGHAEVFVSTTAIHRVALVHATYSQLARSQGLVDNHSLLEFNSPSQHYAKLVSFLGRMSPGQLYLPVNELAVGSQLLHAPLEVDQRHTNNPAGAVAPAVWKQTVAELGAIAHVAMAASERHNRSEFARAGLS